MTLLFNRNVQLNRRNRAIVLAATILVLYLRFIAKIYIDQRWRNHWPWVIAAGIRVSGSGSFNAVLTENKVQLTN